MERGWIDTSARKVCNFLDETDTKFEFVFNFFFILLQTIDQKSLVFHKFNGKYCEQNNLIDRCHFEIRTKGENMQHFQIE